MKKLLVLTVIALCVLNGCYSQPEYNSEIEKAQNMSNDNEERVKSIQEINKNAEDIAGGINEN